MPDQVPLAVMITLIPAAVGAPVSSQAKTPWTESFKASTADLATVGENPHFILVSRKQ